MCELLVYANVDGPDDRLHPMRYRVGDVVVVRPDGWKWGTSELCPGSSFRVICFSGVDHAEVAHLEQVPRGSSPRRRDSRVDISHQLLAPHGIQQWWNSADGTKMTVVDIHPNEVMVKHPALGGVR